MTNQNDNPEVVAAEKRIAELQAQLLAAQARLALGQASSNPALSALLQRAEAVQARITSRARFWSGNAAQTFVGRKRTHECWLAEIKAQEALETRAQEVDKAERETLKALAAHVATLVAEGKTEEAATAAREGVEEIEAGRADAGLDLLETGFNLAQMARKSYSAEKQAPTGRPRGRPRKMAEGESAE